jgi:mersacidin/lichenicidin family type 2 lantibiotic
MSPNQIVRAWKDADYRTHLTTEAAASVPPNPAGDIDVADSMLDLSGGEEARTEWLESLGCCQGFTQDGRCDFTSSGGGYMCSILCFTILMTAHEWCPAK